MLMKVCSKGSPAREPANHEDAWIRSPNFADRHLFRQNFAPRFVEDGRVLMFLDSSETLSSSRTLGELPVALQSDGAAATARLVLGEWNSSTTWQRKTISADAFLRIELRGALDAGRSAYRWAERAGLLAVGMDWINTPIGGHRRAPNPIQLSKLDSVVSKLEVEYLCGNTHGDLHVDNIIVPLAADGSPEYDQIRLIDLSGFDPSAPLSRDVATLLLSSILPTVQAGISEADTRTLVHLLTRTDRTGVKADSLAVARIVRAVHAAVAAGLGADLRRIFHAQYLLSLLAQAIVYTSYSNLGVAGRRWYFSLGVEAANAFLDVAKA
ncbi:hypothetical protein [Micromonospora echinofusca]|uniref:Aminoglycoside phosphotransferase domain-containing protein n=1 Tax=Micromonospora echinofusca TaxID=47858 RepID=A0ABS3VKB4_MICEH|nr:hypothetical protein [Micromonospora echinofusca]MBO4204888.1 hypothetical protein [Micromonospora echinofusca]